MAVATALAALMGLLIGGGAGWLLARSRQPQPQQLAVAKLPPSSSSAAADLQRRVAALELELQMRDRTEGQLRMSVVEYKRAAAAAEQFAYDAAHDLRAPLHNAAGFARLLQQRNGRELDQQAQQWLDEVLTGLTQLQQLIAALAQLARVGREARVGARQPLNQILDRVREALSKADEAGEVPVSCVYEQLPELDADPRLLAQMFENLLGNAIKFRSPARPLRVEIRAWREREGWHLTLTDNGIGIPEDQLEAIFTVFRRLHSSERYEGSGIGLALCRRIASHHGAQLWAAPRQIGAEFHLWWPDAAGAGRGPDKS